MKYLFRHSEAAGILTVLQGQHYAGHLENAWNMALKITHGIVHVNSEVCALRALPRCKSMLLCFAIATKCGGSLRTSSRSAGGTNAGTLAGSAAGCPT